MKLTIEHLSAYLPWGLELLIEKDIVIEPTMFFDELDTIESGIVNLAGINHGTSYLDNCVLYKREEADGYVQLENVKPILRPLSDLTKEIEVNGENFVPIEFIGQMIDKNYVNLYDDENGSVVGYGEHISCGCPYDCDCGRMARDFILKYNQEEKYFYSEISMDANYDNIIGQEDHCSYYLIQKLISWHFDIFDLHSKNLCIYFDELK